MQADGERLPLAVKDLGSCDLYPQSLQHNPNGRFVTVCGDGEYIIYTALAWRNKSFGSALEFVWGEDSSIFAVRFEPATRWASWRSQGLNNQQPRSVDKLLKPALVCDDFHLVERGHGSGVGQLACTGLSLRRLRCSIRS